MILIGSRAIRYHVPEFREPKDWDLVANTDEIERLKSVLPVVEKTSRDEHMSSKTMFRLDGVAVEVENGDLVHYWGEVLRAFAHEPAIEHPILGTVRVPPLSYLLLTKHCGLIYHVVQWHKNLEDLYFLRKFVRDVTPEVEKIAALTIADSARMFEARHRKRRFPIRPCHPSCSGNLHDRHLELHALTRLGESPIREMEGAWTGLSGVSPHERTRLLVDLLAEETMVLAAEALLRPDPEGVRRSPEEIVRWVIRFLAVGPLPPGLRYFVVNYYREISARVRPDWHERVARVPRKFTIEGACDERVRACDFAGQNASLSLGSSGRSWSEACEDSGARSILSKP